MSKLTVEDINRYLTVIRTNFENAYRVNTDDERVLLFQTWLGVLGKYPKEVVDMAVMNTLGKARFVPRLGDITAEIEQMKKAYEKTDTDLWGELVGVLREIRYCVYNYNMTFIDANGKSQGQNARDRVKQIFNELDPINKEYIHDVGVLVQLSDYTDDELQYEKGRYLKMVQKLRERAEVKNEMPENVRLIFTERLRIEE